MRSNAVFTAGPRTEDLALKSDIYSLEFPFFAICKTPNYSTFVWISTCRTKTIEIQPSSRGRATMDDKRILVYACSLLMSGHNRGFNTCRSIRIDLRNYLQFIGRKTIGGKDISEVELALDRLAGTRIKTNVHDQKSRKTENFGILERWLLVERKDMGGIKSVMADVTISQMTYDTIMSYSVLTLSKNYPGMPPLTRRIYEIARKHCGRKSMWKISMTCLQHKSGSESAAKAFARELRKIAANDKLAEFTIQIDDKYVIFYRKD